MTVGELRHALDGLEDDERVAIAIYQRYMMEFRLEQVVPVTLDDGSKKIYITSATQNGMLPADVGVQLDW